MHKTKIDLYPHKMVRFAGG